MTRRTSPSNGHTLNSNAFEADTGLPAAPFKMLNVPEFGEILLVKEVLALRISARKTQPLHLGLTLAGLASRFPHKGSPRPHGFLLVMFPNAGHRRPKMKRCAQARIEKP
jgi:hypothetical protein|tara:strand:- start:2227 stop:2556 length:330 start_codon:yes stop_codon:yes gene_type:complete